MLEVERLVDEWQRSREVDGVWEMDDLDAARPKLSIGLGRRRWAGQRLAGVPPGPVGVGAAGVGRVDLGVDGDRDGLAGNAGFQVLSSRRDGRGAAMAHGRTSSRQQIARAAAAPSGSIAGVAWTLK